MSSYKRKKNSELWQYFEEIDSNYATCNFCKNKFSYKTSTSNLKKHLLFKHPTITTPERKIIIVENDDSSTTAQSPAPRSHPDANKQQKRKSPKKAQITAEESFSTVKQFESRSTRDEFDIFGEYVASCLRNISDKTLVSDAKFKINNILYQTEKLDHQPVNVPPCSIVPRDKSTVPTYPSYVQLPEAGGEEV